MDGFLISGSFAKQIKSTIARVDGLAVAGEVARIPTRFEEIPSAGGAQIKLAAFTGTSVWVRMQARQVYFFETDTASTSLLPIKRTESTATAVASMFSIPGVTTTVSMATALVTVAKMNGVWNVVAAGGGA